MARSISFREWRGTINKEVAKLEMWRRWMRHKCRTDLWFLCYEILHFRAMLPKYHGPICRRHNIQDWPKKSDGTPYPIKGDWHPRGFFKTTNITVGQSIQAVLVCPEETIIIEHATMPKAIAIGNEIREIFEKNVILKWLFPDIIWSDKKDAKHWAQDGFSLKRKGVYKERTFNISSAEKEETGGHYTLRIYDDLVAEENADSETKLKAIWEHFKKGEFLTDQRYIVKGDPTWWPWMPEVFDLQPRCQVVGTRWDERDAYAYMLDPSGDYAGQISVFMTVAIDERGESTFPTRWPVWKLMQLKNRIGSWLFSAQMQQDPFPAETALFKRKEIQNWSERRRNLPDLSTMHCYTGVDLNVDDESSSDYGTVVTIAIDHLERIFVMQCTRAHFTVEAHRQALIDHVLQWKPKALAIETTGYQKVFAKWVKKFRSMSSMPFPRIVEMKRGGRGSKKLLRFLPLQPYVEGNRLFVNEAEDNQEELVDEMTRFPKAAHDDLLDACADAVSIAKAPEKPSHLQRETRFSSKLQEGSSGAVNGEQVLNALGVYLGDSPRRGSRYARSKKIQSNRARVQYGPSAFKRPRRR